MDFLRGRVFRLFLLGLCLTTSLLLALWVMRGSKIIYNEMRAGATYGIRAHVNLYRVAEGTPLTVVIYSPLGYWFYLPMTIFSTPNAAFLAACIETDLAYFLPVLFLFWQMRKRATPEVHALLLAAFAIFTLNCPSLVISSTIIHPECFAI